MSRNYWDICFTEDQVDKLAELDRLLTKLKLWDWLKEFDLQNENFCKESQNPFISVIRKSLSYGSDSETLKNNFRTMRIILNDGWNNLVCFNLATKLFRQTEQYALLNSLKKKHDSLDRICLHIDCLIQHGIDEIMEKLLKTYVPPNYDI